MKSRIYTLAAVVATACLFAWASAKFISAVITVSSQASTPAVIRQCPDRRRTPMEVRGIEDAKAIAFHDGRLVALDGSGRSWSYYVEDGTTCEGAVVEMKPARLVEAQGDAPVGMVRIANSAYEAVGITGNGTLVTWEPSRGGHICASGFGGGICGNFLKQKITGVVDVSESASHLLVVKSDGSVLSGGMNDCGQLGRTGYHSPRGSLSMGLLPALSNIVAVATGKRSSMALDKTGKVWTWGNLSHPLVGSAAPSSPTADFIYCGRDLSGPAEAVDATPDIVPGLPPIAAISSLYGFDLALDKRGRVWGWGFNDCGQLGGNPKSLGGFQEAPALIEGLPPISAIAAGARHALYLGKDGSVWATGDNGFSQLAMPGGLPTNTPICVSSTHRGVVDGYSEKPRRIEGFGRATAIAADRSHSAAIDVNGHVWTWGRFP